MAYAAFVDEWRAELTADYPSRAATWQALDAAALQAHHAKLIDDIKASPAAFAERLQAGTASIDLFPGVPATALWDENEAAREHLLKRCFMVVVHHFAGDVGLDWLDNIDEDEQVEGLLDKFKIMDGKLGVIIKAVLSKLSLDMFGVPENWKEDPVAVAKDLLARREELGQRLQGIFATTLNELLQSGEVTREDLRKEVEQLRSKLGSIIPDLMRQSTPAERAFADPRRQAVLERLRRSRDRKRK